MSSPMSGRWDIAPSLGNITKSHLNLLFVSLRTARSEWKSALTSWISWVNRSSVCIDIGEKREVPVWWPYLSFTVTHLVDCGGVEY